ncbi:hypothetical protein E4U57_004213 [Claviceps arundinis]|uniref:Aminoglycoside phosphotransferase domain-containing protein n=1 Tax=Claviceps arundinis TaxID=1623583 RepID=A0A9P7MZH0_9HYPO|nr:hypothetical protein E4U57_004213 [Claviceps arundinis]KAG5977801.1 hypothetical protein E4U56_006920 [Claviceps arundinis]
MDGQPLQLPYFAPKSRLPIPIPSVQDIEYDAVVLHERDGRRVVRFGNHFVIKYGLDVSLTEGENMLFVRQTQPLLAPEVFALFSVETDHGRVNYIIMENVVGDRLDQVWDRLGTPEKCRIADTLRLQIETLRKIPAPGYFGCVGRRPFEENMFWATSEDGSDDAKFDGPFDTESELNDALVQSYRVYGGRDQKANFYRRVLPLVLRENSIVFSHGNLQRKNIMLKPDGQPVLIGWKAAGWYPAYWEHVIAMFRCEDVVDDWHEYLSRIINEYPNEYAWFDMIRHDLWY